MLEVTRLAKAFRTGRTAAVQAVADVSFVAEAGQVFTLLGPSGCGKSTTLRMIAGLERPDRGEIAIAGRKVFSEGMADVPAQRRNVGMVFQSYAIWPHMSVYENAAFPLKARRRELGLDRAAVRRRVEAVLAAVSLDGLEARAATQLSGGQQQRLALARAIVTEPPVVLLDEPLSNLDANLRERMRGELRRMQRDLGVTMVYVTHDQAEALALSHRIAVMQAGRIVQVGTPEEIYMRPAGAFVATFVGKTNLLAAEVVAVADGRVTVETAIGRVAVDGDGHVAGDRVRIAVRPEDVELGDGAPGLPQGVVTSIAYYGAFREYGVEAGGQTLTLVAGGERTYAPGETVGLTIRAGRAVLVG